MESVGNGNNNNINKKNYAQPKIYNLLKENTESELKPYNQAILQLRQNDLEQMYNEAVSQLREKFPTIPEDLNNNRVTIRYKQDNGIYHCVELYSNAILVASINGKNFRIDKIKGKWKCFGISPNWWDIKISINLFNFEEFNEGIEKIIENADKCEIIFKKLDSQKS